MIDIKKLDTYFNADSDVLTSSQEKTSVSRHTRIVRFAKLALPSLAAILIGLLLLFPTIHNDVRDFRLDITKPKKGELEKLHVEDTVLYITDKNNKINNFIAQNIDETEPGSKLIKLTNPEGIIPMNNGEWNTVKAPIGFFNQNNNLLHLEENVEIFYSGGMSVHTTEAFFDFNQSRGYGNKPVKAQGIFGNLNSEGFEFLTKEDILAFTGHSDITIKEESFEKDK